MTIHKEDLKLSDTLTIDRTVMAADRTLMAWVRTGISMISFGFTIYKLLEVAREKGFTLTGNPHGPRNLGLFLIAIGTVSLGMGAVQHLQTMKKLGKRPRFLLLTPGFLTSGTILLLGIFLFASIIFRMEVF
jgi:putative membrane protein